MVLLPVKNSTEILNSRVIYMRSSLFFMICIGAHFLTKAQDTTHIVESDTVRKKVVQVTPYYSHGLHTSASYAKKIDNSDLFRFSSGVSIFNALRGQVPGIAVPSYFKDANASGIRTGPYTITNDALVVVDGIPFNNYIGDYLNINAFDFSSVSVFSNTNALNFLGGVNSGAFVLSSKTGEGIAEPLFEFNAYATYGWDEVVNPQNGQTDKNSEWHMANAIAYSQDYGVIDTRISYTMQKKFFQSYGEPYIHNLKVNTGLVANDKFDVRLIVDGRYSRYTDFIPAMGRPGATDTDETSSEFFVNGNLIARYKLTDWLTASSQLALSQYKSDIERTGLDWSLLTKTTNYRQQANVFLNGSKKIGSKLNISGFTGLQYARQNFDKFQSRQEPQGELRNELNWEDKNPALLVQASVNYQDLFILSSHYRSGTHSNFVNDKGPANAYSVSSSFIFSELIRKSLFSFGKFRTSFGTHTVVPFNSYPILDTDYSTFPLGKQSPYRVSNIETGLDFGFINSRLLVTVSYFQNQETYDLPEFAILPIHQYLNKGWETEIRYRSVQKPALSFESGLVLSNSKSKFDQKNSEGEYSKPILRAGLFNQVKFKSIFASILVESVSNYTAYSANSGFVESSFTKLRDVSLGMRLPDKWFIGALSKGATLSFSGRNLVKLISSGIDLDETFSGFQKSMSINLNVSL